MGVERTTDGWAEHEVRVERGFAGIVRAHDVHISMAAAGPVLAGGDVELRNAGCGPLATGGNVSITNGGCGPVLAAGTVSIERGGCQSIVALGAATVGPRSFVGAVLSPSTTIEEGARVLMTLPQAAVFGAAVGLFCGLVRRRRNTN